MRTKALSSADLPVREGDVIAGKYRIERVLGKGGMGVVALAVHEALNERVAIKFLLADNAVDPEYGWRFHREARLAVQIKDDHVVRMSDFGWLEGGLPFMVMEYLVGRDLNAEIRERGPLPVGEAVEYALQTCAAAEAAHALGIVHRDLKPANLFLTRDPRGRPLVKVLDFGISKAVAPETEDVATKLTGPTTILGSPRYMSPEQIRRTSSVDARSDVWSLGVILHELLTCKLPFGFRCADIEVIAAVCSDAPIPLRAHRPDAPGALEAVILRCLEKDVDRRVQSAFELAEALTALKEEGTIEPFEPPLKDPARSRSAVSARSAISTPRPPIGSVDSEAPRARAGESMPTGATQTTLIAASTAEPRRFSLASAAMATSAALVGGMIAFALVHRWASVPPSATPYPTPASAVATAETTETAIATTAVATASAAATTSAAVATASTAVESRDAGAPPTDEQRPSTVADPPAATSSAKPSKPNKPTPVHPVGRPPMSRDDDDGDRR